MARWYDWYFTKKERLYFARKKFGLAYSEAALGVTLGEDGVVEAEERIRSVMFLLESYEPEFWWFELFEACRRTMMTVVLVPLPQGTVGQQSMGLLNTSFFMIAFVLRPYVDDTDDYLASFAQVAIFLQLLRPVRDGQPRDIR